MKKKYEEKQNPNFSVMTCSYTVLTKTPAKSAMATQIKQVSSYAIFVTVNIKSITALSFKLHSATI